MKTCTFEGCERAPVYPDQSRCEIHRLRWVSEPVQRQPEWLRRKQEMGLPAKDYSNTGHAA
jgi:hypothetical protein